MSPRVVVIEDATAIQSFVWTRVAQDSSPALTWLGDSAVPSAVENDEVGRLQARIFQLEEEVKNGPASYEAGLRDGDQKANKQAESRIREQAEGFANSVAEIGVLRRRLVDESEAEVVRLSLEIAKRIMHRELSVDPSALNGLVKAALEKLRAQDIYKIRVHPGLENLVKAALDTLAPGRRIDLAVDPSLGRGGIVFDIACGTLDASIDTQLREIDRGLIDNIER
jgi:flagellar assembly protein FliH